MSAPFATLVDYWFGELPKQEEEEFEAHLFGCAECTAKLEELAALGAAVRATFREGAFRAVIPHSLYEAMKTEGLRLREYRAVSGGSVNCTITKDDDFVVSRLQAPLAGVRRVDLVVGGGRFEDVPFDEESGEVLVLPAAGELKRLGAFNLQMRLLSVEDKGERVLGEYSFVHRPS